VSGTDGDGFVPVKSADRVLAILELLAAGQRRYSLSEIGHELDIPLSSLHGILRTMQRRRWLEVDETNTRFGVGPQALLVGSSYPRSDPLVARADPVLDWLSERTGETVHYGRLEGTFIIYLAKRESRYQLRIYTAVGKRIPAHAASLGKAILAGREVGGPGQLTSARWRAASSTTSPRPGRSGSTSSPSSSRNGSMNSCCHGRSSA
jgi:DNA-binding IclR family transcriptional regulator